MKKIIIENHTGCTNKGCEALLYGTLFIFNKLYDGNVSYDIFSQSLEYDKQMVSKFKGIKKFKPENINFYQYIELGKKTNLIYKLSKLGFMSDLLSKLKYKKIGLKIENLKSVYGKKADLVVSIGGDMFSEEYGIPYLHSALNKLLFAQKLGIPTIVLANSIGKFAQVDIIEKVKVVLGNCQLVTVREPETLEYLKSIGIDSSNMFLTSDAAFLMKPDMDFINKSNIVDLKSSDINIGLGVSKGIAKYLKTSYEEYINTMSNLITRILSEYKNAKVTLIPHVFDFTGNDDRMTCHDVEKKVNDERCINIDNKVNMQNLTAPQIKAVISKFDVFIGARTHSVIAAIDSGVPSIAISYSIKSKGIMKYLHGEENYNNFLVDYIPNCDEEIYIKLSTILSEHKEIKESIKNAGTKLREKAYHNLILIERFLKERGLNE